MRQAHRIVRSIASTLFMSGVFVIMLSCLRDDRRNCVPVDSSLKVSFSPNDTNLNFTQEELTRAAVYVFGPDGEVFKTWTKTNPYMDVTYHTGIILDNDTEYKIVAWINPVDPYKITPSYDGQTTRSALSDGRLDLTIPADGVVSGNIPMLFYGTVDNVAGSSAGPNIRIPLTMNTYRLDVLLSGLPLDGDTYTVQVVDNNGSFGFDNTLIETSQFTYKNSASTPVSGEPDATTELLIPLTVLRLVPGHTPMFTVLNTTNGKVIYPTDGSPSVNLITTIENTIPGFSFETTHRLDIMMDYGRGTGISSDGQPDAEVTVTINGWTVKDDSYEIE